MNTIVMISIIVIVGLIIAFIVVGIWYSRLMASSEDFLLAGRGAPFWVLATAYLGGFIGGSSVSGYVGYGYSTGISPFWMCLLIVLGAGGFTALFSRRLNYYGRKTKAVTMADFLCERYGEKMRGPAAIIGFFRPGVIVAMQFLAIAACLNVLFGIQMIIGIVISAVVIGLYLVTAGQFSALISQWFQAILQSLGIVLIACVAIKMIGTPTEAAHAIYNILPDSFVNMFSISPSMLTVYILTFGLFYFCDPWMYMWAYVGKSPTVSSNGMLAVLCGSYYNVLPFITGMLILVLSMNGTILMPEGLAGDSLYAWFTTENATVLVGVLIFVGLIMTIVSCGSSFIMNGVAILTNDIYKKMINKNASDKQVMTASKITMLIVIVAGCVMALWLPFLIPLWTLAQAIVIAGLFVPIICAWFWKRSTTAGALASAYGGGIGAFAFSCVAWYLKGSPGELIGGFHAAHVGTIISVVLMIVVSLCTKPDYEKAKATSYKLMGEEMMASNLIADEDKPQRKGILGWLCADTAAWKAFWVITLILFVLHYILAFLFQIPFFGISMIWIALVVGVLMLFLMGILGGRDLVNMTKAAKARKQSLAK